MKKFVLSLLVAAIAAPLFADEPMKTGDTAAPAMTDAKPADAMPAKKAKKSKKMAKMSKKSKKAKGDMMKKDMPAAPAAAPAEAPKQ